MHTRLLTLLAALALTGGATASAQYYEIANQIPNLITPALQGGFNYKGFIEAEYLHGVGDNSCDFFGISTVQGFRYSSWFFMGAGLGVQYVHTSPAEDWQPTYYPGNAINRSSRSGCMVPVFTDFRFNIGSPKGISFFADVRLGASFLVTNSDLRINEGYITNNEYFYPRPSIGIHIPVNPEKNTSAFNIGISYQLLTANYWDSWQRNTTLNALGVNASYEW